MLLAAAALALPLAAVPARGGAGLPAVGGRVHTVLGVVSGGIFGSPLVATLLATALVLSRRRDLGSDQPQAERERKKGRMVRGGRVVARVLLVWVVSVVALLLLDRELTGFALPSFWEAGDRAGVRRALSSRWPCSCIALPVALYAGRRLVPCSARRCSGCRSSSPAS